MADWVFAQFKSNPITGSIELGATVSFAKVNWVVQHITGNYVVLMYKGADKCGVYNSKNTSDYAGSDIAAACSSFENNLGMEALSYCLTVNTRGVLGKAFIPTKDQLENQWAWPSKGAAYRATGTAYFTCTPYDPNEGSSRPAVWAISSQGESGSSFMYASGFYARYYPCMYVQYKGF